MKINPTIKLFSYLSFALLIAIGFAFTRSSTLSSDLEADAAIMFTDYYFPNPKNRDGKKQFVKKLCLESERDVESTIAVIIDDFKNKPAYKKKQIGKNPDVGWHKKNNAIIFRNVKDHKKTYSPEPIVEISTYGNCN